MYTENTVNEVSRAISPGMRRKQLVEIEHARHFAAQLEERGNEFLIVRA